MSWKFCQQVLARARTTQSSLERSVVTYARDSNKEKTCVCSSKLQFRPRSCFTLYHELLCRVWAVNTLFPIAWENWNQTSCQQDIKMSWRGRQLKMPRIRAGGFSFSRGFAARPARLFISDWLGKLKPNKLSTGCQNELKGTAVENATNPGRRFFFFSRLRRSCARLDKTAMLRRLDITRP